jgi:transcriptional regulator with XRE-family HTH domain
VRRLHPPALYAAVDAERRRRELTWRQVARECGVSAHTIQPTQRRARFEVDGILALTGWLGRPIEDFTVDDGVGPS